ncbi:GyrI-like domain-containing protein [Chloroflexota bacterium]
MFWITYEHNIDKTLSLEKLADVASFSRFHFHRIFAAMVGETPNQFIQMIRVQKAAGQLIGYPKKSLYGDAWTAAWFAESGYQPADGYVYEQYLNNPEEHPEKKHIVETCMPVKPL